MTVHLSVDSAVKACVPYVNQGVNTLTDLFAKLVPSSGEEEKAICHYDIKAGAYNLATALTVFKTVALILGYSSLGPTAVAVGTLLFTREVLNQSMSFQQVGKSTLNGIVEAGKNLLKGKSPTQKEAITADAKTAAYLGAFKTRASSQGWKEEMLKVGGYTIFKNFHLTIPQMLAFAKSL